MSSAYRLTISFSRIPGMSKPARSGDFLRRQARGSIARLKRRHDSGSPCQMPLVTLNGELTTPFTSTAVDAVLYRERMEFTKGWGRLNLPSVSSK